MAVGDVRLEPVDVRLEVADGDRLKADQLVVVVGVAELGAKTENNIDQTIAFQYQLYLIKPVAAVLRCHIDRHSAQGLADEAGTAGG